ncbi:uncharacterized protein LOC119009136 isoform X3 [Acanthopagrus latus]|uniref:uncharacterized protein LOC119009136 isoform X3 n=1 Tax=Acanthopagrus latus TaxID=8177 RepID=UPI00187C1B86|nr:uncharacterized protein LOC119009136 isoform X3 [Acanthopagrus latus]
MDGGPRDVSSAVGDFFRQATTYRWPSRRFVRSWGLLQASHDIQVALATFRPQLGTSSGKPRHTGGPRDVSSAVGDFFRQATTYSRWPSRRFVRSWGLLQASHDIQVALATFRPQLGTSSGKPRHTGGPRDVSSAVGDFFRQATTYRWPSRRFVRSWGLLQASHDIQVALATFRPQLGTSSGKPRHTGGPRDVSSAVGDFFRQATTYRWPSRRFVRSWGLLQASHDIQVALATFRPQLGTSSGKPRHTGGPRDVSSAVGDFFRQATTYSRYPNSRTSYIYFAILFGLSFGLYTEIKI